MRRRFSAAARSAHAGRESDGCRYVEGVAGYNAVGRKMVPRAQLFDADTKAIGDGDERVGGFGGVALLSGLGCGDAGDGDDEFVAGLDGL